MDKKVVKLPSDKVEQVEHDGIQINVTCYLTEEQEYILASIYLNEYYNDSRHDKRLNPLRAENALVAAMLEMVTDIDITAKDDDGNQVLTIDSLFSNWRLIDKIQGKVINYNFFRNKLSKILEQEREERRLAVSLGRNLEVIVSKAINFFNDLSNGEFNISDEQMKNVQELVDTVNKSEVLNKLAGKV